MVWICLLLLEFGLLWILECRVSSSDRLNFLLQPGKEHSWGFSPVWVRICLVWCSSRWKAFSHMGHLYGLGSSSSSGIPVMTDGNLTMAAAIPPSSRGFSGFIRVSGSCGSCCCSSCCDTGFKRLEKPKAEDGRCMWSALAGLSICRNRREWNASGKE